MSTLGLAAGSRARADDSAPIVIPETPPDAEAMLAAVRPAYNPPPPDAPKTAPTPEEVAAEIKPTDQPTLLPRFIVRDEQLPNPFQVMSDDDLANYAMDTYIGPQDGLDRGVLNLVTLSDLWEKIPILGKVPLMGFMSNRERALERYRADVRRGEVVERAYLASFLQREGRAADAAEVRRSGNAALTPPVDSTSPTREPATALPGKNTAPVGD